MAAGIRGRDEWHWRHSSLNFSFCCKMVCPDVESCHPMSCECCNQQENNDWERDWKFGLVAK
eukprot:10217308-Ditylum_brightwellii.AAC.1